MSRIAKLIAAGVLGGPTFNGNPYSAYSLLDIFSDDRAAGAVNGTLPVVGGARVVTDGNSKLSIAGGVASFATGGAGAGDPGLWYASQARVFGLVFLGSVTPTGGSSSQAFLGWDGNQSGSLLEALQFRSSGALNLVSNGGSNFVVGAYSLSTLYQFAVVLRGSGVYWFIKGGAFTNWTLLWSSSAGNGASMFPAASAGGTTSIFTADNIRVPVALYTSLPYAAYDTFDRADGALGSSLATGPDGQAGTARAWTDQLGTWAVASNVAVATALSGGIAYATAPCASADVLADVAFTRSAGSGGLILRYTDANNYLRATHDGTNCLLEQVVAGTPTTLRTGVATYAAGAVIRVILSGTEGRLFYNGAAVGAVFTVPASSAADHGLYTTDTGNTLDVFQVMARGTGGEYAGLDAF